MLKTTIRTWTAGDFETVRSILLKTWLHTYASFIPTDDINNYLTATYNDEKLTLLLNDENSAGYLAEVDGIPCGWLRTAININESRFYISSLYILPNYQGFGIGKALLNEADHSAWSKGFKRIYLGVMKQNERSIEWYKRNGFVFEEELPFTMGKTTVPHLIGFKSLKA